MAREAMVWTFPTMKAALTEAGLAAAPALECQVTSAVLTPQPVFNTIAATGCAAASQSPGQTGWQLDLAWLTDWVKDAADSLSWFAWNNDAQVVWVQLIPDKNATEQLEMSGRFYCVSGGFGGTFGDGSASATTATWPALEKPTIGPVVVAAAAEQSDAELAEAG